MALREAQQGITCRSKRGQRGVREQGEEIELKFEFENLNLLLGERKGERETRGRQRHCGEEKLTKVIGQEYKHQQKSSARLYHVVVFVFL